MLHSVKFPAHRRFKSGTEHEPIGFFSECLFNATRFDLMLGFFSSSAISILCDGFAAFLHRGGRMRLIINDVLTEQDRNAILSGQSSDQLPFFDIEDMEALRSTLSRQDRHFFECLAWLIRHDRLDIRVIAPKNGIGIAHTKSGIFSDGVNEVGFDGSCNFSRMALVSNMESLTVACDWDGDTGKATVREYAADFERVFKGEDATLDYLSADDIKTRIANSFKYREIADLLQEEYDLLEEKGAAELPASISRTLQRARNHIEAILERLNSESEVIEKEEVSPHFPYPSGPRDYQRQAFENWKKNGQKGLFAMATGTGKTITALNCLLEIYNKLGYYKAIILVPTITLVEQWEKECKKFNFNNIIKVCGKYKAWKRSVGELKLLEGQNTKSTPNYVIISTYASFVKSEVFMELNAFAKSKLLLIADEAHNMGGGLMSVRLDDIQYLRRIGLSATPERQFDEAGNQRLQRFFGSADGYTFEYSMREAIDNGALCKYEYYPHIVELTDDEMYEYVKISRQLAKFMQRRDAAEEEILLGLLLKRKRIIHKAANKVAVFRQILQDRLEEKGTLKYTLVYVPEGSKPDEDAAADIFDSRERVESDDDTEHLIDQYTAIVRDAGPQVTVRRFTSESADRDEMLRQFAAGEIDVLTSMKCLDEGVDVPRSELAIFCSSTGNPRQFVQRRGRILRTHPDKRHATIHDLIVIPQLRYDPACFTLEKSLVESEMRRVKDFALLSENSMNALKTLDPVLSKYDISIFNL